MRGATRLHCPGALPISKELEEAASHKRGHIIRR